MIAVQPTIAFSGANALPSFAHRAQSRSDCAAAGAAMSSATAPSSPATRFRPVAKARGVRLPACASAATLQGPLGNVALARIVHGVVLFHIFETFPDGRRHGGTARHVGM